MGLDVDLKGLSLEPDCPGDELVVWWPARYEMMAVLPSKDRQLVNSEACAEGVDDAWGAVDGDIVSCSLTPCVSQIRDCWYLSEGCPAYC
jgi:hypothetical protein